MNEDRRRKTGYSFPSNVRQGISFLTRLPSFLRHAWVPEAAQKRLENRLLHRESRFLKMAESSIFNSRNSPYLPLFKYSGCEYGDLVRMTEKEGLETALLNLYREGVFLTVEEFKGRRPVRRGNSIFNITPDNLINSGIRAHVAMKSGGSRSPGTAVLFDLDFIAECAEDTALALECRGGIAWEKATWEIPGGGALFSLLEFSRTGLPPARWFSQLDSRNNGLSPRFRWANRAFLLGSALACVPMPKPLFVPLENPRPIVSWLTASLKSGKVPYFLSYPSSALRVCRAAEETGADIAGAQFTIAGEPCTEVRMKAIRRTGAVVFPKYAIMETGPLGYGCLNPDSPDDIHFLSDLHAVIQSDAADDSFPPESILFTSLTPSAPLILFNVSMGDQARLSGRKCSCPLEKRGWGRHISSIRSSEKLTCGGMNFMDSDISRVLDDVLPSFFGGGPSDYQILEEDDSGKPVLKLLVSPAVGSADEKKVKEIFIREISRVSETNAVMGLAWGSGDYLQVERREPISTPSGKILHMHVRKEKNGS